MHVETLALRCQKKKGKVSSARPSPRALPRSVASPDSHENHAHNDQSHNVVSRARIEQKEDRAHRRENLFSPARSRRSGVRGRGTKIGLVRDHALCLKPYKLSLSSDASGLRKVLGIRPLKGYKSVRDQRAGPGLKDGVCACHTGEGRGRRSTKRRRGRTSEGPDAPAGEKPMPAERPRCAPIRQAHQLRPSEENTAAARGDIARRNWNRGRWRAGAKRRGQRKDGKRSQKELEGTNGASRRQSRPSREKAKSSMRLAWRVRLRKL